MVVGSAEELEVSRVTGLSPSWCGAPPAEGRAVGVQLRAHGAQLPARVLDLDPVVVELERPARGVAAGQTLALYSGTRVLGAATISDTA